MLFEVTDVYDDCVFCRMPVGQHGRGATTNWCARVSGGENELKPWAGVLSCYQAAG